MEISIMTNEDPAFYQLLGRFLANRAVASTYGDKLWDDSGDIWAIAHAPDGKVMGFAALRPRKHSRDLLFCNDYIDPGYRGDQNEVQSRLLDALLEHYPIQITVIVVASAEEKEFYEAKGFYLSGYKGQFLEMKRPRGEKE